MAASSSSKGTSSSPFHCRKPSYSWTSSTNTRLLPRSCSTTTSFHGFRSITRNTGYPSMETGSRSGDSISVTIRFRPLSGRENQRGDEMVWYPDGDKIVRNQYNPDTAYAFDRVFGPDTNTPEVYEVAALPVVKAAMEGVNSMLS